MTVLTRFMRFFFRHFYHMFAWTYDFVAAFVSLGRWNLWIEAVLPYIQGATVLEIGHGPGYLQQILAEDRERFVVGLDESAQMGRLARKRLTNAGFSIAKLTRGLAQSLPFPTGAFDIVVSTFPAEFIFEADTMSEVRRVLRPEGRFIILSAAWIVGRRLLDRGAALLFKVTGQAPVLPLTIVSERLRRPFEQAGFRPQFRTIEISVSLVLIVVAAK